MTEFQILFSQPEDAEALVIYLNYIGSETDNISFKENEFFYNANEEAKIIEEALKNKNGVMLVAKNKIGEIIGESTCFSNERRSKHVFTFGITVRRNYWYKGIGKALTLRMIEECRLIGCKKIMLHVYSSNASAIVLYKKLGFELEGILKQDTNIGEKYVDTHIMSKFL